jgi:pentatricopeptide repeat protein
MEFKELRKSGTTYTAAIAAMARCGLWQGALALLNRMNLDKVCG